MTVIQRSIVLAVCLSSLGVAPHAFAQNAAAAEALFDEGQAALERGDYDIACQKLRESDRLDPANGTKFNLADCEERRGRLASAWELFRRLVDTLPADDERLAYAKEHAASLGPRVPRLTLTLEDEAPADTEAELGGTLFTSASFGTALPVNPGTHQLTVRGNGRARTYEVTIGEGEKQEMEVTPLAAPEEQAPLPANANASTPDAPSGDTKTIGFVIGGVGVAGLLVGGITGAMGLSKQSQGDSNCSDELMVCNQKGFDANNSARSLATVSTVGFVVGIVGVGVGTYFVLTSGPSEEVAVSAQVDRGIASLGLHGRW